MKSMVLLSSLKYFAEKGTQKHSAVLSLLLQQLAGPGLSLQSPSSLGALAQSCWGDSPPPPLR